MLRTLGVVQACFDDDRFRALVGRRLGGRSLLEWIVRRITDCQQLDAVIIVAGCEESAGHLRGLAPMDVPVVASDAPDALGRFAYALERFQTEAIVRIRADRPFVDPGLIDRLVVAAETENKIEREDPLDYMSYRASNGGPAILSPVGLYAEWVRASAIHRAAEKARLPLERAEVTPYIYGRPDRFNVRLLPTPKMLDRDDLRLTIDAEEDWDYALMIVDALGFDQQVDYRNIADLLERQPAMREEMARRNRIDTDRKRA